MFSPYERKYLKAMLSFKCHSVSSKYNILILSLYAVSHVHFPKQSFSDTCYFKRICETVSYIFIYNCDVMQNIYVQIFNQYIRKRKIWTVIKGFFCYCTVCLLNRERFGNIFLQREPSEHYSSLCLFTSSFYTKLSLVRFAFRVS
jgi:hypothetical protein